MSSFYKKQTTSNPNLREFNVGEPDDMSDLPNTQPMHAQQFPQFAPGQELSNQERDELQRFRRENAKNPPRIGEHARKRVEILANIGRLNKDVNVEGIVFSLRTLKTKETREVAMVAVGSKNDLDASFEIRRQTLARAIYKIDGEDVELALGGRDFNLKLQLVDDMEEAITTKLYKECDSLRQESEEKYGLKTPQEVKEVVEDIKK